jgi:Ca2+-binding RTX toxin-like protein
MQQMMTNYEWKYTRNSMDAFHQLDQVSLKYLIKYLGRDASALAKGNETTLANYATLESGIDDPVNAIQHAFTSADWTWEYGRTIATHVGNYKERNGYLDPDDSFRDQYNNEVGRRITEYAKAHNLDRSSLDDLIIDALVHNHLIVDEDSDSRIGIQSMPTWTAPSEDWEGSSAGRDYTDLDELSEDPLGFLDAISPLELYGSLLPGAWVYNVAALVAAGVAAVSPLVFDLDDSGTIELKSLLNSTTFWDIDNDGFAEHSGWATGGDGLLAIDLNLDGIINDHTELFGTGTVDGFSVLANYDTNHDGLISSLDDAFDDLIMWVDANEDGYSEGTEIYSLTDLDIISINLNSTPVNQTNQGHHVSHTSTFIVDTGSGIDTRIVHDVWFEHDNANTVYNEDVDLDPLTAFLPILRGYGVIADMPIAASLDTNLRDMLSDFWLEDINDIFTDDFVPLDAVKDILFRWAGVDDVSSTSRGPNIDARELGFLEALTGEPFMQRGSYSNPYYFAAQPLKEAFQIALDNFAARLIAQSAGGELFEGDWYYNIATDSFEGITGLDLTTLGDLETLAGAQTNKDIFWRNVVRVIDNTIGVANLSGGDEAALDSAIYDSDNTLSLAIILGGLEWDGGVVTTWGGTSGDDTHTGGTGMDTMNGNNGNDTLDGGTGADRIDGSAGADILDGQGGDDYLLGGTGNDTYKYTAGQGWDTFEEYGADTGDKILFASGISFSDLTITRVSNYDMMIEIDSGAGGGRILVSNQFNSSTQIETLEFAGGGSPYALGTLDWTLYGTAGNDTLYGVQKGGDQEDTIYGGDGDDTIYAYAPNYGDTDANWLYGEAGNDTIYGGSGADTLSGGDGNDYITGGTGNDTYIYNTGDDVFGEGVSGTDEIQLAAGIVSGDISYYRHGTTDLVIVVEGKGSITIDHFYGSSAYKIETLRFADASTVNLASMASPTLFYGTQGNDSFTGANGVTDTMYGYGGNDSLFGYSGDDFMYGGDGNDNLYGSYGNDYNEGGAGNDNMEDIYGGDDIYVYSSGLDVVYDYSGTDILRLTGSTTINDLSFTDLGNHHKITITASVNEIQLYYVDYNVGYTIETMEFADGFVTDTAWKTWAIGTSSGETINGGAGNDTIVGKAGADTLNGNNGNDAMHGGADNDTLNGGSGTDLLHGGTGDDALYGNDGLDTLFGGEGADDFIFEAAFAFNNVDVIKDFNAADGDALDISDILVGYDPMTDAITDFVTFTNNSGNSQVFVDRDGNGASYSSQQIALIMGLSDLNVEAWETSNNLVTV